MRIRYIPLALLLTSLFCGCNRGRGLTAISSSDFIDPPSDLVTGDGSPTTSACIGDPTFTLTQVWPSGSSAKINESVLFEVKASCVGDYFFSTEGQGPVSFHTSAVYDVSYATMGTFTESVTILNGTDSVVLTKTVSVSSTQSTLSCTASASPPTIDVSVNPDGSLNQPGWPSADIIVATNIAARITAVHGVLGPGEIALATLLPTSSATAHGVYLQLMGVGEHFLLLTVEEASNPSNQAACFTSVTLNPVITSTSAPTVSLTLAGITATNGQTLNAIAAHFSTIAMSWSSTHAHSCTLTSVLSSETSGSHNIVDITTAGAYTLTCSGDGGSAMATVNLTLSGTYVAGSSAHWYLGDFDESCDDVCATHAGYHNDTRTFAGNEGAEGHCQTVHNALERLWDMDYSFKGDWDGSDNDTLGCYYYNGYPGYFGVWRSTNRRTESHTAASNSRRFCACNQ